MVENISGAVTCPGIRQNLFRGVKANKQMRHEMVTISLTGKATIGEASILPGSFSVKAKALRYARVSAYRKGRGKPMPSRIPHGDANAVVASYRHRHEVEVVTTHFRGEEHSSGDLETRYRLHHRGQKSFLDLACQTAVVILFPHQFVCMLTLDE